MSSRWIYEKVNSLVKRYHTRDPMQLINELNINLEYLGDTESLLGVYQVMLRNRFIFIASNIGSLKKVVLAHELGHDQLHRAYCKNGAAFHENRIFNPTNRYEIEANIFAAHLLIPDDEIFNLVKSIEEENYDSGYYPIDENLLNLKISEMIKMNMIDSKDRYIEAPDSEFLHRYKPLDDEWY